MNFQISLFWDTVLLNWTIQFNLPIIIFLILVWDSYYGGRRHQTQLGSHGPPGPSVLPHNCWWGDVLCHWSGVLLLTGKGSITRMFSIVCICPVPPCRSIIPTNCVCFCKAPSNMKAVLQAGWLFTVAIGNFIVLFVAELAQIPQQVQNPCTVQLKPALLIDWKKTMMY